MNDTDAGHSQRLQEIADRLDCVTEEDLCLLAHAKLSTLEAWRKRGQGPSYIRIGNRVLYPRKAIAAHLETLTRERASPRKGLL